MDRIDLVEEYPSRIASMLLNDEIDLGLVPVAVIPLMKESYIISDYCIGSVGEVGSVALFSEVPIEQVRTVLLDYQSRTSVNLARLLLTEYWKMKPVFERAGDDFQNRIAGSTAAIVIGDRALNQRKVSTHCYDLGAAWLDHTGLPFVYAAWVSNKPLSEEFKDAFNRANGYGISHLSEVIADAPVNAHDMQKYYSENISYVLDDAKRKGLELFLSKLTLAGDIE